MKRYKFILVVVWKLPEYKVNKIMNNPIDIVYIILETKNPTYPEHLNYYYSIYLLRLRSITKF